MLHDIAVRKLVPCHQQVAARRSLSPTSSPRRLRRQHYPSDASQDSSTRYIIPEEQFHEGMLKCKLFDEDSVNSLFTIDDEDLDRPARYEYVSSAAFSAEWQAIQLVVIPGPTLWICTTRTKLQWRPESPASTFP